MGVRRFIALLALAGLFLPALGGTFQGNPAAGCSMTACTCRHHGRAHQPAPTPAPGASCHFATGHEEHGDRSAGPARAATDGPTLCGCGRGSEQAVVGASQHPVALPPVPVVAPDPAVTDAGTRLEPSLCSLLSALDPPPPRPLA